MSPTVVLIDDDCAVLASLEALFATADYRVRTFESAGDFLEALDTIPFACVVTDLRMPNMDGLALIKRLKNGLRPDWPVVVISGHADAAIASELTRAGALDCLVKPFSPATLLDVVGRATRMGGKPATNDVFEADSAPNGPVADVGRPARKAP
ncbi:Response regulator protein TmoT [Brevundimonas subvibrioides]|uniref:response regulator transcription factor n=1 Tax=Brevundimonas subvibrioides TaxID=74313 RepID=UPI0032D571CF